MGNIQISTKHDKIIITLKFKEKAMKKKILKYLFMFVLCFAFVFIPRESFAASGDWIYDEQAATLTNEEGIVINNVTANGNELIIGNNENGSFTTIDLTGEIKDVSGEEYRIVSISDWAFYNCIRLTEVSIPSSITSIGEGVFHSCTGLNKITIPDNITSIGNLAFFNCSKLSQITIPNKVTSIGEYVFYNCENLSEIIIPESITSIGEGAFYNCIGLTEITIPEGITSIEEGTFNKCENLAKITLPEGVTSIGNLAFDCCYSLTEINIPESVTSIGENSFAFCTKLEEIIIPKSVKSIGLDAFYNCSFLERVYLMSEDPAKLGDNVFYSCSSLSDIYVPSLSVDTYKKEDKWSDYAHLIKAGIYKLTVENGSGSGYYLPGKIVTIKAKKENNEKEHFLLWTIVSGEGVVLADENAKETTFTMPNNDVTITANFEIHDYEDGKCSICGYEDENYIPPKDQNKNDSSINNETNKKTQTALSSVNTSDENNVVYYVIALIISIISIGSLCIYKNKKGC